MAVVIKVIYVLRLRCCSAQGESDRLDINKLNWRPAITIPQMKDLRNGFFFFVFRIRNPFLDTAQLLMSAWPFYGGWMSLGTWL